MDINTIDDIMQLEQMLFNGENVEIRNVGNITHTIKLSGGRFSDYDINYINADIAKIVLSYQDSFYKIVSILEKDFDIKDIDKNQLIKFKLERGSLDLIGDFVKNMLEAMKNMESKDKKQVLVAIIIAILLGASFATYISYLRDINNTEAERENRQVIARLASNQDMQKAVNAPKITTASILKDDESAKFNAQEQVITNSNKQDYNFREIIDTTTTQDTIGEFVILGYEKTLGGDRKFKMSVHGTIRQVSANLISADDRIRLAMAIERGDSIKLRIRTVKEYNKITEVTILDVIQTPATSSTKN
ncbi:hypothetical protein UNSW3_1029 [Campylobacter concisus UNSW3]|uniref:Uncharacterized protein n=1 Tax=Campylobacter concisus UNSW3 TaxID=1242966 RepID=U2G6E8_9BACT|nr:hypothetical protein [Campylobacter concisus]ERJ23654.1 hypothetical protein UNSW3_1029 [Campylobacter concisus UNSW3]